MTGTLILPSTLRTRVFHICIISYAYVANPSNRKMTMEDSAR